MTTNSAIVLQQIDGTIALVFPPSVSSLRQIRQYYAYLAPQQRSIEGYYLPEVEPLLTEQFGVIYQSIANLFRPRFNIYSLTSADRHAFFVAREPIALPSNPELIVPGLSHLEELLGFAYSKEEKQSSDGIPKAIISTGEYELDLIVECALTFKEQAGILLDRYDCDTIAKLLEQANDRMRGEEALKEKQAAIDREWFDKNKAAIEAASLQNGFGFIPEMN